MEIEMEIEIRDLEQLEANLAVDEADEQNASELHASHVAGLFGSGFLIP